MVALTEGGQHGCSRFRGPILVILAFVLLVLAVKPTECYTVSALHQYGFNASTGSHKSRLVYNSGGDNGGGEYQPRSLGPRNQPSVVGPRTKDGEEQQPQQQRRGAKRPAAVHLVTVNQSPASGKCDTPCFQDGTGLLLIGCA